MIISQNKKQTIISLLIIMLLSFNAHLIVGQGADFGGNMIVVLTFGVAIGVGSLLLILRILAIMKQPGHFLYNYFGTLNISLALIQIAVIPTHGLSFVQQKILLINMSIGLAIFYDIYKNRHLSH